MGSSSLPEVAVSAAPLAEAGLGFATWHWLQATVRPYVEHSELALAPIIRHLLMHHEACATSPRSSCTTPLLPLTMRGFAHLGCEWPATRIRRRASPRTSPCTPGRSSRGVVRRGSCPATLAELEGLGSATGSGRARVSSLEALCCSGSGPAAAIESKQRRKLPTGGPPGYLRSPAPHGPSATRVEQDSTDSTPTWSPTPGTPGDPPRYRSSVFASDSGQRCPHSAA
mmetsp:Transcript_64770/g.154604  ORF Transcript_64770/g.154604 Transcript_64770/m.154604 type:complete len:227 (+) Transcript_64770:168-848(+)